MEERVLVDTVIRAHLEMVIVEAPIRVTDWLRRRCAQLVAVTHIRKISLATSLCI